MNPTSEEVAWAAGLFEGEGCITLWRATAKTRSYPRVELASSDEDAVLRFRSVIGGRGSIRGPIVRAGRPNDKPQWRVAVMGVPAREVLSLLAPYLGERRTARMNEVLEQATGGGGRWPK